MDKLLELLSETDYISGERLCVGLGLKRGAIWKRVQKLRAEGYSIESAGKRGYKLRSTPDSLLPGCVAKALNTQWAGRGEIDYAHVVDSTNTRLKTLALNGAPRGSLALCERQSAGRGRLQRSWDTPEGEALLFSLLLRPVLPAERAQLCTLAAAVAVAQAVTDVQPVLHPRIKWPNDVLLDGKKCVGILSEMSADMDGLQFVIVGIGINVHQEYFIDELADKATSLLLSSRALTTKASPICRRALLCAFLSRMETAVEALEAKGLNGILAPYVSMSATLGARVRVIGLKDELIGTAKAIDETGALIVEEDSGTERRVLSGDVSVRGIMGYT